MNHDLPHNSRNRALFRWAERFRDRVSDSDLYLQGGLRWRFRGLLLAWLLANLVFWEWWIVSVEPASRPVYWAFTLAFFYEATFLPSMFLFYVRSMRRPRPIQPADGLRVALITLCVPSDESTDVIERQLKALSSVNYPHDSWILDEGDDPRVRAMAKHYGCRYFTRRDVPRYNQLTAPFQAKTKAGNVNAWVDAYGAFYDYFVQFDIDHNPNPDYLERVLGFFRDPAVGWVQSPSVYGNLTTWVARGAAEQELVLQGPLQRGFFGFAGTPFIIGSHSAYRMSAVREIGGFQPTRAEDHLDTVMLAAHGYRGIFQPEIIAIGSGPDTFTTYLRQQFAWAMSMMQVLFFHTPRLLPLFGRRQAVQFLFAQTWYVFWSLSMLVLFTIPPIVLLFGTRPSDVPLLEFAIRSTPIGLVVLLLWAWTRQWQEPRHLGLTWRGMVLHVARWPIVVWALMNVCLRIKHPYMVTPKLGGAAGAFSLRSQLLYLLLAAGCLGAIVRYQSGERAGGADGYVLTTIWGMMFMVMVVIVNASMELIQVRRAPRMFRPNVGRLTAPAAAAGLCILLLGGTVGTSRELLLDTTLWIDAPRQPLDVSGASDASEYLTIAGAVIDGADRDLDSRRTASSARTVVDVFAESSVEPGPRLRLPILPNELPPDRFAVGAYLPTVGGPPDGFDIEHWYVSQDDDRAFRGALNVTRNRRTALITLEPFPTRRNRGPVLEMIINGLMDADLARLAGIARESSPQIVYLRWGHEMDLSGLYPWAANRPDLYRAAYRHVVTFFRENGASNVRWVWSPAGEHQAPNYYPGDEFVDLIGLTVLADEQWDANWGASPQSFDELLRPRYERVVGFNKPIIVAELGVSGTEERQAHWLTDALSSLNAYPSLRGIVYFSDQNAPNNRLASQPDWRLPEQLLINLTRGDCACTDGRVPLGNDPRF
ncbi:MAG: glycosyltransferase family 2 protein [Chloroflexota bacterium]